MAAPLAPARTNQPLTISHQRSPTRTRQPIYGTFLGGSGDDRSGTLPWMGAYVTGYVHSSVSYHTRCLRPNFNGEPRDAFVAKLNTAGSGL